MATNLIGKVSPTMGGTYSSAATYYALTFVEDNGSTYLSLQTVTGIEPGVTSGWEAYWMLIAQKGNVGDTGRGLTVLGNYITLSELQSAVTNPSPGDAYGVGISAPFDIYIWSGNTNAWGDYGQLQGATGQAATVSVGTTTTGQPGTSANVNNSGTSSAAVFNFTIPRGANGSQWYTGTGVTGTSTTPTIFSASGVTTAYANDMYLNTLNANIYQCANGGSPTVATWYYVTTIDGIVKTINSIPPDSSGNVTLTSSDVGAATASTTTATLTVDGWSNNTQTVNVTGATASNTAIVSPAAASRTAYNEAGCWCSAQGAGTLTFTAESVPAAELSVAILILT